jgi:hypothetical protein
MLFRVQNRILAITCNLNCIIEDERAAAAAA